ncbi:MAG: C1 family peptidase [Candidatus Chlorobium antarcticum]|jgi:C1A family cysteine protease|nr:C1 family peptidase [Candidatus Chlorobium antarcticum]
MYAMKKTVCLSGGSSAAVGTGWLTPLPDMRDYSVLHPEVAMLRQHLDLPKSKKSGASSLPPKADLREWCSPVETQGAIGSCTAHAASGLVEYFERRAFGHHIDCSRLFIYKTTRNLMGTTGDTGAWLRNTMGALALCGVPPEKYWTYTDKDPEFDAEPSGFAYAVADNFEALRYFCHDPIASGVKTEEVLAGVKKFIASGIPSVFGFFGFGSFEKGDAPGHIPMPCPNEQAEWGHAILAVGYDDKKVVENTRCGTKSRGAILIRNSWGAEWGEDGYGWVPYDYVLKGLALDFWSLFSMGWIDTGQFGS